MSRYSQCTSHDVTPEDSTDGHTTAVEADTQAALRPRRPRRPAIEVVPDPVESAEAAGLRYVSDTMPGIRRKKVRQRLQVRCR